MATVSWPDPKSATALPADDLGLRILRHLCQEQSKRVGRHRMLFTQGTVINNVLLEAPNPNPQSGTVIYASEYRSAYPEYAHALEEAWAWLLRQGLIAETTEGRDRQNVAHFFVTRLGLQMNESDDAPQQLKAIARLDMELHPRIANRVRAQFLMGEHDGAVFIAMREVEVRVRELTGGSDSDLGVALMKDAFKQGGSLRDPEMDKGEADATMALFWGALGLFKNPASHRNVTYEDPIQASEVILLADLLLRILDRASSRLDS